ncbi:hypothetical protein LLS1_33840 [Leifsonia sp. LS1]|uniref:hypothetical protein n=1 Tax=Leifsonia sp. LS1 TaxID=2828483 RepID=UPI001CFE6235|nr:hypothetical protein [Leifsonia sp. LS1]GIT81715.1 hypothetical protein LLS1_33840 [Leifsonia sp. LS1]
MIGFGEPEPLTCSRAGCRETATWRIEWRNPRIHTADRVKVWLACAEHVEFLREFLAARDFPLAVKPVVAAASDAEPVAADERTGA